MNDRSPDRRAANFAAAAAAAIIALQLAGKATRDALFLSTFGVGNLPSIVIASAILSGALAILVARVMARTSPARLVPRLFMLNVLLLISEWALASAATRLVALLVYLHFTALGAISISGFWAMVNERFDPRTARRFIARITGGASIGGLLGGVLPERVGSALPLLTMLPILAGLQVLGIALARAMQRGAPAGDLSATPDNAGPEPMLSATRILRSSDYLLALALLVALTTSAEGVLDYVFKARAAAMSTSGQTLLRFFAAFYTATALIGVLLQVTVLRWFLARLGVARSAAALPAGVTLASVGAFFVPGLASIVTARGIEVVLHNSLFRAGYELLFTPVAQREKRATKLLIDVGAQRVGDVAGGLLILISLARPHAEPGRFLLGLTAGLSLAALSVARRLQTGYVRALEGSLQRGADQLPDYLEEGPGALLQTVGGFDLSGIRSRLDTSRPTPQTSESLSDLPNASEQEPGTDLDHAIQSGSPEEVSRALAQNTETLDQTETVIGLLAWDAVTADAGRALGTMPQKVIPILLRHLLDPDEDFAVRRRLVPVIAGFGTPESFEGLFQALADRRFEVRYRAGLALSHMAEELPDIKIDRDRVLGVVSREMSVERTVWESRQLIDAAPEAASLMQTELLHDRVSRSLEHLFSLLSLILPRSTLRLTFHALHTDDSYLRGTALEYLATVLPEPIWRKLWSLLETGDLPTREPRASGEALRALLRSQETISVALSEIRKAAERGS